MRIVDLTHLIAPDMPVYPGTQGPTFTPATSYEEYGFRETLLSFYTHTGTHMDAPAHLFAGQPTLDLLPVSHFLGSACVIACGELGEGTRITMAHIDRQRENAERAEFLLFHTGWDRFWGTPRYFGEYPCIDDEVADFILGSRKKGVGLDTISLDPIADERLTLHRKLLGAGIVLIENLENLHLLGTDLFTLCALPLKHVDADGAPVRAIALLESDTKL